jgi:hypothetical protein
MKKTLITLTALATAFVMLPVSEAHAQYGERGAAPGREARDNARARGNNRSEWGGGRMTTATVERQFERRMEIWTAAGIPDEKRNEAKEIYGKIKTALNDGNTSEAMQLNRSIMQLLTDEQRQAVMQQQRAARERGGNRGERPRE